MSGQRPEVVIFTDGACSGNPGPGGWGAILKFGETEKVDFNLSEVKARQVAAAAGVPFIAYRNPALDAWFHLENHLDLLQILPRDKG